MRLVGDVITRDAAILGLEDAEEKWAFLRKQVSWRGFEARNRLIPGYESMQLQVVSDIVSPQIIPHILVVWFGPCHVSQYDGVTVY